MATDSDMSISLAPATSNVFNRKQPYKPMPFVKAGQSVTPNPLATESMDTAEDNTKEEEVSESYVHHGNQADALIVRNP